MTPAARRKAAARLKALWGRHDKLERAILVLERKFTDAQLKRLGAAGAK